MQGDFDFAFSRVVAHEGGFQDDPKDRGNWTSGKIGKGQLKGTKFGISAMAYPNEDIRNLTLDRSKELYKRDYWDRVMGDDLPTPVAYLAFDAAVQHGVRDGSRILQRAARVADDGFVGPVTLRAVLRQYRRSPEDFLRDLTAYRALYYAYITDSLLDRFGVGWFRRVVDTFTYAKDKLT